MSVFYREVSEGWVAKFCYRGRQRWVPGSPFPSREQALDAEAAYRKRIKAGERDRYAPPKGPHTVYRLYSGDEVVYVGITAGGVKRFGQHRRKWDWWPRITHATFEHFATQWEAQDEELRLIHELLPIYNSTGKPRSTTSTGSNGRPIPLGQAL